MPFLTSVARGCYRDVVWLIQIVVPIPIDQDGTHRLDHRQVYSELTSPDVTKQPPPRRHETNPIPKTREIFYLRHHYITALQFFKLCSNLNLVKATNWSVTEPLCGDLAEFIEPEGELRPRLALLHQNSPLYNDILPEN